MIPESIEREFDGKSIIYIRSDKANREVEHAYDSGHSNGFSKGVKINFHLAIIDANLDEEAEEAFKERIKLYIVEELKKHSNKFR